MWEARGGSHCVASEVAGGDSSNDVLGTLALVSLYIESLHSESCDIVTCLRMSVVVLLCF